MKTRPGHERVSVPKSRAVIRARARVVLSVSFVLLGVAPATLQAGGIHVHHGPDAPEKLGTSNEAFYKAVLKFDHDHPRIFAHEHPFYARMLNDPAMIDDLLKRWESDKRRFEHRYFSLWKFLDGYMFYKNSQSSSTQDPPSPPNSGPGSNNGVGAQSIPEPSTAVLCISGLVSGLAWRVVSRSSSRPMP